MITIEDRMTVNHDHALLLFSLLFKLARSVLNYCPQVGVVKKGMSNKWYGILEGPSFYQHIQIVGKQLTYF